MGQPNGRFPSPWSVDETQACFIVRDHNGHKLAYVYFEDEPGRQAAAKLLTKDEARRAIERYRRLEDGAVLQVGRIWRASRDA